MTVSSLELHYSIRKEVILMKKIKMHPLDTMTPVERRIAAEEGREIDRMPVNLFMPDLKARLVESSIPDLYHDVDLLVDAEVQAYQTYGSDWMSVGPNSRGMAEAFGNTVVYPEDNVPRVEAVLIEDYSQLADMSVLDIENNARIQFFIEAIKRLSEVAGGVVNISASVGGPLTIAAYLRGTENLLRDLRRQPDSVHELLDLIVESQIQLASRILEIPGVDISLGDPVASGNLISPKNFREFVRPSLNRVASFVYDATGGVGPSLHICGSNERVWTDIRELPLSTFSIDNVSDLGAAVEFFGDKFPITGNVDPVDVVLKGSRDDIHLAIREALSASGSNPQRHTLGVGCDIPFNTPFENISHYMEAVRGE